MTVRRSLVFLILLVAGLFATGLRLEAQSGSTGSILGSVKDSTGASVPDVEVVVTNTATGVKTAVNATSTGDYTVLSLIPGSYEVSVQATGFSKQVVNGITLTVNQQARVNIELKPGGVSEVVEVSAGAVALDTDNSAISQLVSSKQVVDLPINGRNFFDLLSIGAGAVTTSGEQGSMRVGKGNPFSINGSRPEANTYFLDGMMNTDQALNTPSVVMSIDAIQEFKVLSGTYSAQYGFGANQVSVTTKSGGNKIHGTLFEFNRNDAFDAVSYLGSGKQKLRKNQFGYVADGPIYIPFLYDGRNKTFWMANYEGNRTSTGGNNGFGNVPLPAELEGKFLTPVRDPLTGQNFAGDGQYASIIPADRFSRVANVTISNDYIPAPNCLTAGCNGNFRLQSVGAVKTDQQTYRVDQNLGRFGSVFGRGTFGKYTTSNYGGASGPISGSGFTGSDTNWIASHTINIRPNLVNQFSIGQMDAASIQNGTAASTEAINALGFAGVFPTDSLTALQRSFTNIGFNNPNGEGLSGLGGPVNAYTFSDNPLWQVSDSVSYIHGAHAMTVGADYRKWSLYRDLATDFVGDFSYSDYATNNQVGDFLLGTFASAASYLPGPFSVPGKAGNLHNYRFSYFAAYIQDDWKVNSNLTLNLGLRWDLRAVPTESRNHLGWLDKTNAAGGMCIADKALLTDGVAPEGNGFYRYCGRTNPAPNELYDFAPRIGGAYRVNSKTVVRAGYGIFWDGVEGREIDNSGDIYPYVSRTSIQQTAGQATYKTTDQLFPVTSTPGPIKGGPDGPNSFIAVIISEKPDNPYVTDWSLSIERALTKDTTFEVNYIGTKGSRLLSRQNINQAYAPQNPAFCDVGDATLPDSCAVQARRPFSNFATYLDSKWVAPSNYNALNVKVEHRTGHATVTSIYSWAKSMDQHSAAAGAGNAATGWQGFLNNHDTALDYGRSDFNVGQRFVTSFTYDLPVGRGMKFGGGMNRIADLAIGGWKTSGIVTLQQGFPFSVGANDKGGLLDSYGYNRANQIKSGKALKYSTDPTKVNGVNQTAFTQPAFATYGSSARNVATGPGTINFDLGLKKAFNFTEGINFVFQADAFNAFNHLNYNSISNNVNNTTTYNGVSGVPNFGQITGAADTRRLQLSGKINF